MANHARGSKPGNQIQPRFRVLWHSEIAVGPGKAELLAHLAETGSLVDAARRMDMSYMRAWKLLKTMNQCFREPLIVTIRGGKQGGGATLTPSGRRVLQLYRRLERQSLRATRSTWRDLAKLLRR